MFIIPAKYLHGNRLVVELITKIFPKVDQELASLKLLAGQIPDPVLRHQALSSIQHKRFHVLGGSVYSLYPKTDLQTTLQFIVAFQTISDYLDNLCDRSGVEDETAFRQLHLAMLDATNPQGEIHDYYSFYPYQDDNQYLQMLVQQCQEQLLKFPSYQLVQPKIQAYVRLYTDLQSYKHLPNIIRESLLFAWAKKHLVEYPAIFWGEFAAATGSTLGVFLLIAAAFDPLLTTMEIAQMDKVYFPWLNGLHILLDYYIDAQEDLRMGDLNFTHYYDSPSYCQERLIYFVNQSLQHRSSLRYFSFHKTVITGLLAMYLSDPKASSVQNKSITRNILKAGGIQAAFFYYCCRILRLWGKL